jgi:hypothetical protein
MRNRRLDPDYALAFLLLAIIFLVGFVIGVVMSLAWKVIF